MRIAESHERHVSDGRQARRCNWRWLGLAGGVTGAVVSLAWLDRGIASWLRQLPHGAANLAGEVSAFGEPTRLMLVLIAIAAGSALHAVCRRGTGKAAWAAARFPVFLAAVGGVATLLSLMAKFAIGRARPLLAEWHLHAMPFSGLPGLDSFPSSQAACVGAVALAVAARWPRWWAAWLIVAVLMGSLRVLSGMHWTSDILAGLTLGAATTLVFAGAVSAWRKFADDVSVPS